MTECEAFNVSRAGMCLRELTRQGDCPEAHLHGDEFEERPSLAELERRARNSSLTDPTWRTDYRT